MALQLSVTSSNFGFNFPDAYAVVTRIYGTEEVLQVRVEFFSDTAAQVGVSQSIRTEEYTIPVDSLQGMLVPSISQWLKDNIALFSDATIVPNRIHASNVPRAVTRFQALAALMQAGMLETVETVIAGSDDLTRLAWANALQFERYSSFISSMAVILNMTEEQLDNLFIAASKIN